ncbi:MAG: glycerol-3-phosphate 1-O-acyltransferase PlsY [Thermovirgaceae bacterium]
MMTAAAWMIAGYLFGSIPSGYLAVRVLLGKDIRTLGSGNIGATNVSRFAGGKWGVGVALFDMAKGGLVVFVARLFGVEEPWVLALTGFAGVLGHNFPLWLNFRGGKGVATSFGVIFFWNPAPALLGGAAWYVVMKLSKYVSVGSMVSLATVPVWFVLFKGPPAYTWTSAAMAVLAVARHHSNIVRLVKRKEEPIGS